MSHKAYKAVIFDWDGTLMDSTQAIVNAMQAASNECALPVPDHNDVRNLIGLGMAEVLAALFPTMSQTEQQRFRSVYRTCFIRHHEQMALYSGAEALIRSMFAEGVRLAVATGKGRRGLDEQLKASGLSKYFHATRCAEESKSKPDPAMLSSLLLELDVTPEEALMVGDTEYDVLMAQAIDVPTCAITHGAHEKDRLMALGPTILLEDLVAFKTWWQSR